MKSSNNPGILAGSLVGVMLTAALLAVFYAAWQVVGLPFVPLDLFDWITRILPGPILAFAINHMVASIRALNVGPTFVIAKAVEQAMGIMILFVAGVIGGGVLFGIVYKLRGRYAYLLGLVLGAVLGVPVMLISLSAPRTAGAAPVINALWIIIVYLFWGTAFGWTHRRLVAAPGITDSPAKHVSTAQASVKRVNRRQFLIRLGGATAAITVSGAVVGALSGSLRRRRSVSTEGLRWSAAHALPNADAAVKPAPGTRPEYTPLENHYRIDINTVPPKIDERSWRLQITGLVEKPLTMTLDELRRYEPMHQFITLSCISNPVGGDLIGTTRWSGVSLQRLLPDLRLKPGATHLKISSADGFYEVVSLEIIRADERVMLAYAWDGVPLLQGHGYPLRIYIPDVHGMKQPKWIESIEAIDHWEPGYWVTRGWDKTARMKATSVIDTVAVNATYTNADRQKYVPIGGIAHAGARGISKVELQVDGGPWHQAALRIPLSHLTWVIWRVDWPFQAGDHLFTVRCYDGSGAPQITAISPPDPNGASGLYSIKKKI
jgi:DMSO/TMAO reductase YedYZ molybdopterin-dependent catalytic subunit